MTQLTLSLLDPDPVFGEHLAVATQPIGWQVVPVATAADGLEALPLVKPDCIMLDLALPDVPGLVFLRTLYQRKPRRTPLVVCSVQQAVSDIVLSLRLGADDFIRKPIDLEETVARVENLVRTYRFVPPMRYDIPIPEMVHVGPLTVCASRAQAWIGDQLVHFTPSEFKLLSVIALAFPGVAPYSSLRYALWGGDRLDQSLLDVHTLAVHVGRLKSKLQKQNPHPDELLLTARSNLGYQFSVPESLNAPPVGVLATQGV